MPRLRPARQTPNVIGGRVSRGRLASRLALGVALSIAVSTGGLAARAHASSGAEVVRVRVEPQTPLPGALAVVHIELKQASDAKIEVEWGGKRYASFALESTDTATESARKRVALIPIDYEQPAGSVTLRLAGDPGAPLNGATLSEFQIAPASYPSETLSVSPKHVNPRKRDLARIARDRAEVSAVYRTMTPERLWTGGFEFPVKNPTFTSPFGGRRVYNGQLQSVHFGTDFKAAVGTPIYAAGRGRVSLAKNLFFTGNTVLIDHGYGLFTLYAHLSRLRVKQGEVVTRGQKIGLAGATGRVSGPHLHWGAILLGRKVNPMGLVEVVPQDNPPKAKGDQG